MLIFIRYVYLNFFKHLFCYRTINDRVIDLNIFEEENTSSEEENTSTDGEYASSEEYTSSEEEISLLIDENDNETLNIYDRNINLISVNDNALKNAINLLNNEIKLLENNDICVICQENMLVNEKVKKLKCKHKYHSECITNCF